MLGTPHLPRPTGYTLAELLAVLATIGITLAIATPPIRRTIDRQAVSAARNAVATELARARLLARTHGGAALVLDAESGVVWIRSRDGDTLAPPTHVRRVYDARIDLGGVDSASVTYDRLGIGRMTSRTVRLVRHHADARLTISAYGRVRLW